MTSRSVEIAEPDWRLSRNLKDMPAPDLGAVAIRAAVERAGLRPEEIETAAMGSATLTTSRSTKGCRAARWSRARTFFGAAIAAIDEVAKAQDAGSGSYSNAAIGLPDADGDAKTREEQILAVRIARAMWRARSRLRSTRPSLRWISRTA